MARARVPVFAAVLFLTACVAAAPITHRTEAIAHVRAPQPKTYNAVLDFFSRPWFEVDTTARSSGLLKVSLGGSGSLAMCYNSESQLRAAALDQNAGYQFSDDDYLELWGGGVHLNSSGRAVVASTELEVSVTGDSAQSTVHLAGKWLGTDGKPLHCQLTGYWNGGFEDAIRGRAETRAPFWHKAQP